MTSSPPLLIDKSGSVHHDNHKYNIKSKVTCPIGVVTADCNSKKHQIKINNNVRDLGKLSLGLSGLEAFEVSFLRTLYKGKNHYVEAQAGLDNVSLKGLNTSLLNRNSTVTYGYKGVSTSSISATVDDKAVTWNVKSTRPFSTPIPSVGVCIKAALKGGVYSDEMSDTFFVPRLSLKSCQLDTIFKYRKSTLGFMASNTDAGCNISIVDSNSTASVGASVKTTELSLNSPLKSYVFCSRLINPLTAISAKICSSNRLSLTLSRHVSLPISSTSSLSGLVSVCGSANYIDEATSAYNFNKENSVGNTAKLGVKFDFSSDISEYITDFFSKQ